MGTSARSFRHCFLKRGPQPLPGNGIIEVSGECPQPLRPLLCVEPVQLGIPLAALQFNQVLWLWRTVPAHEGGREGGREGGGSQSAERRKQGGGGVVRGR